MHDVDAVVVGAGVNGLVAATMLADADWSVALIEASDGVGGACRSVTDLVAPGFITDLYSAFYPLGVASPVLSGLGLERHGLTWSHAPSVLAHPTEGGPTAVISRDIDVTAASLDRFATGDGDSWRRIFQQWQDIRDPFLGSVFGGFPPVRHAVGLLRALGPADALRFARFALLPVRRFATEEFSGEGGGLLFAGNALHTDIGPESAGSAVFGWLLAMLGQDVGFPVPVGGAGQLAEAVASRARSAGVTITLNSRVERVLIEAGRATGVRLADGSIVTAAKAVLTDVDAMQLYRNFIGEDQLSARVRADLERFQWDNSTVKVDWALSAPIPWSDPACAGAGTVHVAGSMSDMTQLAADLAKGLIPAKPFALVGQMTTSDPSRSPTGTESAWAYAHAPQHPVGDAGSRRRLAGGWAAADVERVALRIEERIESQAPGFRSLIIGRHVAGPPALESADRALHGGALNGGTAALHQQLIFRPLPGLARAETPIRDLYLAGMSAHPSGGVHGAAGANAARAALRAAGVLGPLRRRVTHAALDALTN